MISTQGLAQLRIAATLVHGIPGLRMSVRGGDGEVAVSVGWALAPIGTSEPEPRCPGESAGERVVLTPCVFRKAVAHAHAMHEQGRRMAFLDFGPDRDPLIDIVVPSRGVAFGGGIYRVPLDGRWLFAFATTLDAPTCRAVATELVDAALPLETVTALGVRPDEDTGVSIVYAETSVRVAPHQTRPVPPAVAGIDDESRVIDLLQAMVARFAAEELISDVQASRVRHG